MANDNRDHRFLLEKTGLTIPAEKAGIFISPLYSDSRLGNDL